MDLSKVRKVLLTPPTGLRHKLLLTVIILAIPPILIFVYLRFTPMSPIEPGKVPPELRLITFAILVISLMGISLIWRMINSIMGVHKAAGEVSEGNLDLQIEVKSDDEIGKLAGSLNQIAAKLQETVVAVENEKNKIETMVRSMDDGVVMTDEKNELVIINPAARRMLGFAEADKIDIKSLNSMEISEVADLFKEVVKKGDKVAIKEISSEKPQKMTLSAHIAPVRSKRGEKLGVVTVLRDITRLKEIDQMKSDFVSNVSHELRTPLTSIRESIGLILEGITGEVTEKQTKFLLIAKRNAERLTNLINDILDLSKIEAGKIEINKSAINLVDLIKELTESFRTQAKDKKISLENSFAASLPDVYADPDRVSQVLNNLLSNAFKFTSQEGKIRIEVKLSSDPKFAEVKVQDTGSGIASQDLGKVFTRFARLESMAQRVPGTGLGLAIVKEIVDLHQGEVWVESEAGKGSTFYFTLPVREKR